MCRAVDPHSTVPQFLGDWFQFLGYLKERTMGNISKIYTAVPFLEADYLRLLMDLEDAHHFTFIDQMAAFRPTYTDMSAWMSGLVDYFEKAERLRDYADSHLTSSGHAEPIG
jgi:hypothetical protein